MHKNWQEIIQKQQEKAYFQTINQHLNNAKQAGEIILPQPSNFFRALNNTALSDTKVVILGQDPYHGLNQANGLAFSVPKQVKIPPSLNNIFKAIRFDLKTPCPLHGDLTAWANQGVLLLNTVLTVTLNKPNSHKNIGWQLFTDHIIKTISANCTHVVFLLWGNQAKVKCDLIAKRHTILQAPHPSPLSAYKGFITCKHFSKTNQALINHKQLPINWVF
jgi:uracil-DNA glycosylase